jgi:hypothetical protein
MSSGEQLYLALVIGAFATFGITLFVGSWVERSWAKANGKG